MEVEAEGRFSHGQIFNFGNVLRSIPESHEDEVSVMIKREQLGLYLIVVYRVEVEVKEVLGVVVVIHPDVLELKVDLDAVVGQER